MSIQDDFLGKNLGGYHIEARIGKGGMSTVYRAIQTSMKRTVALKILPRDMMKDDSYLARFEREVAIVARLEHRNIVPVYDHGSHEGQPFIAMRYMASGSVDQEIAQNALTLERTLEIIEQIAPALDYAHEKNILHRDLKPSNILIGEDGGAYLTDFGIARILGVEGTGSTITTQGVIGTPSYMSPEQAQGNELDGRSDLYSLGVVLYEMLTGRRPFISDTPYSVAVMQVTSEPPSPRNFNQNIPLSVEQVILKSLKKKPEDRYQTAQALAAALRMAIENPGSSIHDTQPNKVSQLKAELARSQTEPSANNLAPVSQLPTPAPFPYVQQATAGSQRVVPVKQKRRRRSNNMWLSMIIGALIGCGILALLVIGLIFVVQNYVNNDTGTTTQETQDNPSAILATVASTLAPPTSILSPTGTATMIAPQDGTLLYFVEHQLRIAEDIEIPTYDIYSLNLATGSESTLTADEYDNQFPSMSPDGEQIVFQSQRDGDSDLYIMNKNGDELRQVLNNDINDILPAWSPDGEWIAFASDTVGDGNYDIFIVRPDGSELRQVVANEQRNSQPRWHPSGESIIYTTGSQNDASTWEIALVDLTGKNIKVITDNDEREAWATFSPNGDEIAFVVGNDGDTAIARLKLNSDDELTILHTRNDYIWGLQYLPDGQHLLFNAGTIEQGTGSTYVIDTASEVDQRTELLSNLAIGVTWIP